MRDVNGEPAAAAPPERSCAPALACCADPCALSCSRGWPPPLPPPPLQRLRRVNPCAPMHSSTTFLDHQPPQRPPTRAWRGSTSWPPSCAAASAPGSCGTSTRQARFWCCFSHEKGCGAAAIEPAAARLAVTSPPRPHALPPAVLQAEEGPVGSSTAAAAAVASSSLAGGAAGALRGGIAGP